MSGPSDASRFASPSARAVPQTSFARSGMNRIGIHPSATSAVMATLRSPRDATQMGIDGRTGCAMILSALPSPVPCPAGSGRS